MSMLKLTETWSPVFSEPGAQIVQLSSRGLMGSDRTAFMKRASTDILVDLEKIREKVAADETLVHLLAIGATEDYGCNRNGDGFRRKTCEKYHPTFAKFAKFYRDHKNRDPHKSYGRIIKTAWNDDMRRIELLVALNSTETAARRNKGLVADKEMEKLAKGKDLPVSMACRVPYDICSYCANKAQTVDDYCTGTEQGGLCKAGGLKNNIGTLVEVDGGIHQLHADNDQPCFIDISHVKRGADRIASTLGILEKSASDHGVIKSADLARQLGVVLPEAMMLHGTEPADVQQMLKTAYLLAQCEHTLENSNYVTPMALAFSTTVQGDEPLSVPAGGYTKIASLFRALADERIALPLSRFIELTTQSPLQKSAEVAAVVARELPGIYTRLLSDPEFPSRIKESKYTAAIAAAPALSAWAVKLASTLSLTRRHVDTRVVRASLYGETPEYRRALPHEKTAASRDVARQLAEEYAVYKLAFLSSLNPTDPDLPLTRSLSVVQNYAH